jgi:hypothetical protein
MSYHGQLHDQAITNIVTERLHPGTEYSALNANQQETVQTASSDLYLTTMFIHQSNRRRYGKLSEDLENSFTKGNDNYPENLDSACHLINEFKCWQPKPNTPDSSGVAFTSKGKAKGKGDSKDKDGFWQKKATCHHCKQVGHICPNCPKLSEDLTQKKDEPGTTSRKSKDKQIKSALKKKTTFAQTAASKDSATESEPETKFFNFGFCSTTSSPLNLRDMILLDNQSTVDLFCNPKLVSFITKTKQSMTVLGNGGTLTANTKAHVENYGSVWYHPQAIPNILSLKNVSKRFRVTYDSQGKGAFIVHKPNGINVHFVAHQDGLHYHNTHDRQLTMVTTVAKESKGYSKRQIEQAKVAQAFQAKVGHPSTSDLKQIIQSNQIVNCPVKTADIGRTDKIFGPSLPILKGKTTRHAPLLVVSDYVAVPPPDSLSQQAHLIVRRYLFCQSDSLFCYHQ